ncbi:MAG: xylulokinase [Lachnospiraceae bacterium]|nr:xylulokinase [Lachnospiraceae bacterium]MDD3616393.1 xylulokinase [Lachnospiraceae bacterium]
MKNVILGIDIGTSSIKAMLLDVNQGVVAVRSKAYDVDIPKPDYAEQEPKMWWQSLVEVLNWLRTHYKSAYESIAAVGYSGQMHGLVMIDKNLVPVRPAIIWLDQRTKKQITDINNILTESEMGDVFRNRVSSGFAFPSLLWVKDMEPHVFSKIKYVMCPKDYIRLMMTGEVGVEVVDASSTGIFSTAKRDWAWEIIERFHLPKEIFPKVHESCDIAGTISNLCAKETGLSAGIPVIYGTGDQPAQSIGNGVVESGTLISNIGTGGQISAFIDAPLYDKKMRTNTFCHAMRGGYTIYGATLCSGMSLNWIKNKVLHVENYDVVNSAAAAVNAGADGLIYLPYLSGERTPHMDSNAKGMFFGLKLRHGQEHFLRAVMEGVIYGLKDCLEILKELGIDASTMIASGGGAMSEVWLQIQADILEKEIYASTVKEQACLGSCILAAVGAGVLPSLKEGVRRFVTMGDKVYTPNADNREVYAKTYACYKELYGRTKDLM